MRSKVIIAVSVVILGVLIFFIYKSITDKSINDYVEEPDQAFSTVVNNFSFYCDDISSSEASSVSNVAALMGVEDEAVIAEEKISESGDDFNRDIITMYTEDIDYNESLYVLRIEGDTYYIWTDKSGNLRGMHLDGSYELIELR